ncbi:MAG TPA: TetR/AcrR family transcriptional regulator [Solirubrobacteraceae bacterium]|nr:TetR/AcrR family transcriptional regulator [Solirubrobacteraceae bacterium]
MPTANSKGTQPRRRLSAPERRARIEDAATTLIGQRGYSGASMDAIAFAAGITAPVLYEHFSSKPALYEAVLRCHFANLRAIWSTRIVDRLSESSVTDSLDAWFSYVEENPDAARLLFREPAVAEASAIHRAVSEESRTLVLRVLTATVDGKRLAPTPEDLEMRWVVLRGVLQGLALWWVDHPQVSRQRVLAAALNALAP